MDKLFSVTKIICGFFILFSLLFFPGTCFAQSNNMTQSEIRVAREKLVTEAKKYIASPYERGATGPDKFDCSGFVYYVAQQAISYQLPRTVKSMYGYVQIIPESKREMGDLVFFRTTSDGTISHVGLYVGNNQFISAASDGPNTGVILSSLKESYWKSHYAASGKFLPDSALYGGEYVSSSEKKSSVNSNSSGNSSAGYVDEARISTGHPFLDKIDFDANITCDWALFTEKRFMPNFRGLSNQVNAIYRGKNLSPGIGTILRWNYGVKAFQWPFLFSLSFGEYVRTYAGPVFTIGKCYAPDTDDEISPSIFPGIIGVTLMTPALKVKNLKFRIVQDFNYTIFNNDEGAALSPLRSFSTGFEFSTGISVTFPLSMFFKGK